MLFEIISHSASCLSFIHRIKMKVSEDCDKTDGNMIENGTWTSVLGMLQRLEIDVAHMPITMSSSRLDVVDFTMPAVEMRYCHLYR